MTTTNLIATAATPGSQGTGRAMTASLETPSGRCLDEDLVLRFFAGNLTLERMTAFEEHVDGCASCAALVQAAAPLLAGASGRGGLGTLPAMAEPGRVLGGRYRLERLIGWGATGFVFCAQDQLTEGTVAVKILRDACAAQPVWLERLTRELKVARALNHPNVCRVFDLQVLEADDQRRFLVMELGVGSLDDELREADRQPPPLPRTLADAEALAWGLAAMHQAGILHRDIKPANLLRMADGRLALSDFGLATLTPEGSAVTRFVGTPLYMAPEVLTGEAATPASDLWALGYVMHELFFAKRPAWRTRRGGGRVLARPAGLLSWQQRALAELCARCLEVLPRERPGSARQLAAHLRAVAEGGVLPRLRARLGALGGLGRAPLRVGLAVVMAVALGGGLLIRRLPANRQAVTATADGRPPAFAGLTPTRWLSKASCASFAPKSDRALVHGSDGRGVDLLDLSTGKRQTIEPAGKDAVFSPDERWAAYVLEPVKSSPREEEIWLVDLHTSAKRKVASGSTPRWSADGPTLHYYDWRRAALMAHDLRWPEAPPVKVSIWASAYSNLSPDGQRIYMATPNTLQVIERSSGRTRFVLRMPPRRGLLLAPSPDERLIAFGGYSEDPLGLWVADTRSERIARVAEGYFSAPSWRNQQTLTFDFRGPGQPREIWQIDRPAIEAALREGFTFEQFWRHLERTGLAVAPELIRTGPGSGVIP